MGPKPELMATESWIQILLLTWPMWPEGAPSHPRIDFLASDVYLDFGKNELRSIFFRNQAEICRGLTTCQAQFKYFINIQLF